jgi:hypothetical protein
MNYFHDLDARERAAFGALWDRFAATGIIRCRERLDQLEDGLLLFRTPKHRMVGFAEKSDVIVIDAFSRREFPGKRPEDRLEEARRIRHDHLALQGGTDALPA